VIFFGNSQPYEPAESPPHIIDIADMLMPYATTLTLAAELSFAARIAEDTLRCIPAPRHASRQPRRVAEFTAFISRQAASAAAAELIRQPPQLIFSDS